MRKKCVALAVLCLTIAAASGCARTVTAYSDSILTRSDSGFAPPNPSEPWNGEYIVINMVEAGTVQYVGWHPAPGTAMAAPYGHPNYNGLASENINTVIYSFGTNDANYYAFGTPGSHDSNAAKFYALHWVDLALQKSATCVVWVLGANQIYRNHSTYGPVAPVTGTRSGDAAAQVYASYMQDFNGWLRSFGATIVRPGGSVQLRLVDWGAMAANPANTMTDRVHPSIAGATALGQALKVAIKSC
jgi:hypothetical protein